MDAIVQGTERGLAIFLNVIAMLIVLVALVHLANAILGLLGDIGSGPITLQGLLAYPLTPVCWLMGIPWAESFTAAQLLASKIILNEFVAYLDLAHLPEGALSPRSRIILVYGMCGFANFASVGIMVGGLAAAVPQRRAELVELGLKSIFAGVIATCLTGCIVGILN
jgi:CNT family concentrative nucleoside transporter